MAYFFLRAAMHCCAPPRVLRRAAGLTGRRRLETIPVDVPRVDVALVGWNDRVVPLLRELDRHVASGSVVHVLSERRLDERERSLKEAVSYTHLRAHET